MASSANFVSRAVFFHCCKVSPCTYGPVNNINPHTTRVLIVSHLQNKILFTCVVFEKGRSYFDITLAILGLSEVMRDSLSKLQ